MTRAGKMLVVFLDLEGVLIHEIIAEISFLVSHELSCMTPKILGKP